MELYDDLRDKQAQMEDEREEMVKHLRENERLIT